MTTLLEGILLILISGSIVFYFACAVCSRRFFAMPEPAIAVSNAPVSVLVPVCGLDAGAWDNWSSLCKQDYLTYEVLFGVVDPQDPAVPLLQQLAAIFPDRVRLLIDLPPRGINHKDSTLSYLLAAARYETLVFADSDIRVSSDYIHTVTAPLANPAVGLVTCAYVAHNPQFLGAALASLGRCCDFIPSALIARVLDGGLRFAIGVTIATRKATLADYGGLHLNRIGSDYNLGKRAALAGYQVELSHEVLESDTGRESLGQLYRRELRWARTIRFNRGAIYYTQAFCYGTVYGLLLLLIAGWEPWTIAVTLTTFAVRYAQAIIGISSVRAPHLMRWLWAMPLRDAISFGVWVGGAFGRKVYWRGRQLRIRSDGLISQWEEQKLS